MVSKGIPTNFSRIDVIKVFSLVPFGIDPQTGVVNISRQLDISENQQYVLTIEVFDGLWKTTVSLLLILNWKIFLQMVFISFCK
jgi:hypothetical protein